MRIGMGFVPDVGENIKENMEVQQNLPNFWQQMQGKYHSFSDTIFTTYSWAFAHWFILPKNSNNTKYIFINTGCLIVKWEILNDSEG